MRRQLGGGGRLPRALEAHHQDHQRRGGGPDEAGFLLTKRHDELFVHDLDDLLAGGEALGHFRADGPLLDPGEEGFHDDQVHIGLEKGQADLAQRFIDVALGQAALAAQTVEGAGEPLAQGIEHGSGVYAGGTDSAPSAL